MARPGGLPIAVAQYDKRVQIEHRLTHKKKKKFILFYLFFGLKSESATFTCFVYELLYSQTPEKLENTEVIAMRY